MRYSTYVVCECGWHDEPSFGNPWFTRQHFGYVCPSCGRDLDEAEVVVGRLKREGPWWAFWRPKVLVVP